MYTPMLTNHVNGCHRNHAFFMVQKSLSLRTSVLCISGVPMKYFAPMKNCPGGCKVGQIRSRGKCYEPLQKLRVRLGTCKMDLSPPVILYY